MRPGPIFLELPGQTGGAQESHGWHPQIISLGGDQVKTVSPCLVPLQAANGATRRQLQRNSLMVGILTPYRLGGGQTL